MSQREPFVPFWRLPSVSSFLRERKLQAAATILSAISAWYAWRNNVTQTLANYPSVAFQNVSISAKSSPPDFHNVTMTVSYRNAGGDSSYGVVVDVKQVTVGRASPTIAHGDDGTAFLRGDQRTFTFDKVDVGGANTAVVACFRLQDPRVPEPKSFPFTFKSPSDTGHFPGAYDRNIIDQLKPCFE